MKKAVEVSIVRARLLQGRVLRRLGFVLAGVAVLVAVAAADERAAIHLATDGQDTNPGTPAAPVATLVKAIELAERRPEPCDVVVHGGTYFVEKTVTVPASQKKSRLVIRAADNETPVFDGSIPIRDAEPLAGAPGVYTVNGDFHSDEPPPVWLEKTGRHLQKLVDLEAVKRTEYASVVLSGGTLAIRLRDRLSPVAADLRMSQAGLLYALIITRDNVTVKEIEFRNFILNTAGSAIRIGPGLRIDPETPEKDRIGDMTDATVIDSCVARNCHKGFHIYTGSANALISRCRMLNSITGIWVSGVDSVVEDCSLVNDPDWLLEKAPDSHRAYQYGVRMYNYCARATIRRNLIKGFTNGIHCKNGWGTFHIENNTVIQGLSRDQSRSRALRPNMNKDYHVRYNIFAGFAGAFGDSSSIPADADLDGNVFWGPEYDFAETIKSFQERGIGLHNVYADPRFAAPREDDYRLLPGSPAIGIDGQHNAGAFPGVPADYSGVPNLRVSLVHKKDAQTQSAYPPAGWPRFACYVSAGRTIEANLAVSAMAPVTKTRFTLSGEGAREREFRNPDTFELPDADGWHKLAFQVQDAQGGWSAESVIHVALRRTGVQLIDGPQVTASRFGALFSFQTDRYAWGKLEYMDGDAWIEAANTNGLPADSDGFPEDYSGFSGLSSLPLLVTGLEPDVPHRYRLTMSAPLSSAVKEGTFTLSGRPKIIYVSPAGKDSEAGGSREAPYRTIQFALDRALPGDRVRILPGVYFGSHLLTHGGTKEHPLVVEGLYPNTVTLDGRREIDVCLRLDQAPHVLVRNLNFRWYNDTGVAVNSSASVRVTGCRFHNQYWRTSTWTVGTGLMFWRSSNFSVDHCIFSRGWNGGIVLDESSGGEILHNTFTACAVMFIYWRGWWKPSQDITIKYNSFNWNGNQMLNIMQPVDTLRSKCVIDWNNYGTTFQKEEGTPRGPWGEYGRSLPKPFPYLPSNREFMYYVDWDETDTAKSARARGDRTKVFVNMDSWQEFSGQDANSIFADPKWIDPETGRFDVAADSPNLLPDGTVIGALGYLGENPNVPPEVVVTAPCAGEERRGALTISAEASDFDGTISKLEFYAGDRRLGESTAPPHRLSGVTLAAGRHVITVRASDDRQDATVSDPVVVTITE